MGEEDKMDNVMENFVELIKECSVVHPAAEMDFAELSQGLFSNVEKGFIDVNFHPEFPHLAIFKYNQECLVDRHWNKFTLAARGLILDLKNREVVCSPFIKFFNYNEIIDAKYFLQSEYVVTEKVDGSLGIMFFYEDEWRVATCGSFASPQAEWAMRWMNKYMPLEKIDKNNTYLLEIIYPENKIVVGYDFEGLVLLGIIDSYGLEYGYEQLKLEAVYMETRCAAQYDFKDMDSILNKAKTLDVNSEGYVIRFKNGVRLKIKGDEYIRVHKLMCEVTPLAIWNSMADGECLEELIISLPEEMEKDFHKIVSIFEKQLSDFIKEVVILFEKSKHIIDDKELALYMKKNPDAFKSKKFKTASSYIFSMRKGKFYLSVRESGSFARRSVFRAFRPSFNHLEGYKPSTIVSMFTTNNNG